MKCRDYYNVISRSKFSCNSPMHKGVSSDDGKSDTMRVACFDLDLVWDQVSWRVGVIGTVNRDTFEWMLHVLSISIHTMTYSKSHDW